jgi:hypothetical protein
MSYLQFEGIALEICCNARTNSGTCNGIRAGNTRVRGAIRASAAHAHRESLYSALMRREA